MEWLLWLGAQGLVLFTAAAVPCLIVERRWRWRWREVEEGRIAVALDGNHASPYRESGTVPSYLERAPRLLRVAAFSCLFFGQMFVPGLVMGVFGLVAAGIGVVSIPGLITAAKLYSGGLSLLRRDPVRSFWKVRDAAQWALWLNGIIIAGSIPFAAYGLLYHHGAMLGLVVFFDGYGLLSILQALLCLHAVRRYEDALFVPTRMVRFRGAWHQVVTPPANERLDRLSA